MLDLVSNAVLNTLDAHEIPKELTISLYFVKRARYFFKNPIYPSSCDDIAMIEHPVASE